jgi:hypothetical protein
VGDRVCIEHPPSLARVFSLPSWRDEICLAASKRPAQPNIARLPGSPPPSQFPSATKAIQAWEQTSTQALHPFPLLPRLTRQRNPARLTQLLNCPMQWRLYITCHAYASLVLGSAIDGDYQWWIGQGQPQIRWAQKTRCKRDQIWSRQGWSKQFAYLASIVHASRRFASPHHAHPGWMGRGFSVSPV